MAWRIRQRISPPSHGEQSLGKVASQGSPIKMPRGYGVPMPRGSDSFLSQEKWAGKSLMANLKENGFADS